MFERYLTEALTTHFGHFVENLDSEKVRLSAWRGELILEDLTLRCNALDSFMKECPVEVSFGKIGNLELRIPWKLLRSKVTWTKGGDGETVDPSKIGCSIVLSNVDILITPKRKQRRQRNDEKEVEKETSLSLEERRIKKEHNVQQLLDATLLERVAAAEAQPHTPHKWAEWGRALVTNLLSTLSVTVRDIHIRYEDPGTCLGFCWTDARHRPPFVVGMMLRQFSVQTTHLGPETETTDQQAEAQKMKHKLVAAYQLSVYWDSESQLMSTNAQTVSKVKVDPQTDATDSFVDALSDSEDETMDEEEYYACAFSVLNDTGGYSFVDRKRYSRDHTYLLHPVSPSLQISLVDSTGDGVEDESTADSDELVLSPINSNDDSEKDDSLPPSPHGPMSTFVLTCPPCLFGISRSTLEDMVYMRKSFAVLKRSQKARLHETTLRRLTRLRPTISPLIDPRSWWRYALEATLILSRGEEENHPSGNKQKRGWLGLARAMRQRREYVQLYSELMSTSDSDGKEALHQSLILMEDELLPSEIVAFRMSAYPAMRRATTIPVDTSVETSKWQGWIPGVHTGVDSDPQISFDQEAATAFTTIPLSLEHRCRMFDEMALALDREQENRKIEERRRSIASTQDAARRGSNPVLWKVSAICSEIALEVNGQLPENDLHPSRSTRPQHRLSERPIVRLSFAAVHLLKVNQDGSWEFESSIASLHLKNLTLKSSESSVFSNLIGPKLKGKDSGVTDLVTDTTEEDAMVYINGSPHPHSASVFVKRMLHRTVKDVSDRQGDTEIVSGSTTHTHVRLSPLEVVYATNPVAALSRIFTAVKTPELVDDYHRMTSVVMDWRIRQRKRLLSALAHRRKKIFVDIDIDAPVVLIPEDMQRRECPLLVIDLGRVQFRNASDDSSCDTLGYDDKWQLELKNMQVVCTSIASYQTEQNGGTESYDSSALSQQLVEPFSLDFEIYTKIASLIADGSGDETRVQVSATLPRLVFNLTSSAVRLLLRLQLQWKNWKSQSVASTYSITRVKTGDSSASTELTKHDSHLIERNIVFLFSAPLVAFKLANDVDGRDCDQSGRVTPLVDFALRDIAGTLAQKQSNNDGVKNMFDAKLRCVDAIDSYQTAGPDFASLLSSVTDRETWQKGKSSSLSEEANTDLVSVQFTSFRSLDSAPHSNEDGELIPDKLSVSFHELYVEWNPETFAAVQKALRLPPDEENGGFVTSHSIESSRSIQDPEDQFFDALQDDFDDESFDDSDTNLISEISSSRSTSVSDIASMAQAYSNIPSAPALSPILSPRLKMPLNYRASMAFATSSMHHLACDQDFDPDSGDQAGIPITTMVAPLEVSFQLSKLRVNFNKDSRHRRLLTGEMDRTNVCYLKSISGGSKTVARIGNLTISDPVKVHGDTLYGEILGLKTESFTSRGKAEASLLEMEFEMQPRIRRHASSHSRTTQHSEQARATKEVGVTIDADNGRIEGYDGYIKLRFSPMRFVFLQQLWMEGIDYFFEGVLGNSVWGRQSSQQREGDSICIPDFSLETPPLSSKSGKDLPGADGEGFNFTRFEVEMDAPVLLVPVTYRSPQYIRLELSKAAFSNQFDGRIETREKAAPFPKRMQWYNSCSVSLSDLVIVSWCGTKLASGPGCPALETDVCSSQRRSGNKLNVHIKVTWPMGPTASLVEPKWDVDCSFDEMSIVLRRADYALFQHIVSYNVGEVSRHLDEWKALQDLPPLELELLKQRTVVHFGYDKKDTVPTTFDVGIRIPSICCFLSDDPFAGEHRKSFLLEARCTDVNWYFRKFTDRISRQQITCDVSLIQPSSKVNMLQPSQGRDSPLHAAHRTVIGDVHPRPGNQGDQSQTPQLTYKSITQLSGDNVKTLEIACTCIYLIYPAWMAVKRFFQNLPEPTTMTQEEVKLAVQIGDRWYQIGAVGNDQERKPDSGIDCFAQKTGVPQYQPCYQFRLVLTLPHIVLEADSSSSSDKDRGQGSVVLALSHMEYLHVNNGDGGEIRRSFFVHDLEVYTSSNAIRQLESSGAEHSLIHPWCVSGLFERCNGHKTGACDGHSFRLCSDVLRARASYSDMSLAIDVFVRFFRDYRTVNNSIVESSIEASTQNGQGSDESELGAIAQPEKATPLGSCQTFTDTSLRISCDGFELLVVDDSLRHFAKAQELIVFALGQLTFSHVGHKGDRPGPRSGLTNLRVSSLDLLDCLQCPDSRFRLLASSQVTDTKSRSRNSGSNNGSQAPVFGREARYPCRRMAWPEFAASDDGDGGFCASRSMLDRISSSDRNLLSEKSGITSRYPSEKAPADLIEGQVIHGHSSHYDLKLRSLALQWNPSTVIALQRFLGRLRKEAKAKYEVFRDRLPHECSSPITPFPESSGDGSLYQKSSFSVSLVLECLTLCLNKEHQNRRLLQATISGSKMVLHHSYNFTSVDGSVEDFNAWDPDDYSERGFAGIVDENREVVNVVKGNQIESVGNGGRNGSDTTEGGRFLKVQYKTFTKRETGQALTGNLPTWVVSHVSTSSGGEPANIDDYLSVSIAMLQFTYIRERTEEILDYLSNGLPGKGMGATSRAAKGFIQKRIKTRSFLELDADAPRIRIPQKESVGCGVVLRLGDVRVKSWFDEGSSDSCPEGKSESSPNDDSCRTSSSKEWWRVLSLSLQGLSWSTFIEAAGSNSNPSTTKNEPFDLHVVLRKATWRGRTISMHGRLSLVDLTLKYTEYLLLRAVGRDNLGRDIDMSRWDNIEKAYWMEEAELDFPGSRYGKGLNDGNIVGDSTRVGNVAYASDARFIRYGIKALKQSKTGGESADERQRENDSSISGDTKTDLDVKFEIHGLCLTLHRDDCIGPPELACSLNYDVVLFRVKVVEMSVSTNSVGENSYQVRLYGLGLIDLGDIGRLLRERYHQTLQPHSTPKDPNRSLGSLQSVREPCAFFILAEGYASPTKTGSPQTEHDLQNVGPQLVLTVEKVSEPSIVETSTALATDESCSKVTVAKVVINYLSVNALIRPLREIVSFMTCAWSNPVVPTKEKYPLVNRSLSNMPQSQAQVAATLSDDVSTGRSGFRLNLVAHYPRLFFVADESDPHSRALVLHGLAVLNASLMQQSTSLFVNKCDEDCAGAQELPTVMDTRTSKALDARLQNMETYINPDVYGALGLKPRHAELVRGKANIEIPEEADQNGIAPDGNSLLGVALMQPVTAGMEYLQVQRDRFPTVRTACLDVESVSTMVSFEDLSLIEKVLKRWSVRRTAKAPGNEESKSGTPTSTYEVPFQWVKEGIVLSETNEGIVVDSIHDLDNLSAVAVGDLLWSIDGEELAMASLPCIQSRFQSIKPSASVTFRRSQAVPCKKKPPGRYVAQESDADSDEDHALSSVWDGDGLPNYFRLNFKKGEPTGLSVKRSACGSVPVITDVSSAFHRAVCGLSEQNSEIPHESNIEKQSESLTTSEKGEIPVEPSIPKPGAVVVCVNDIVSADLGYEDTASLLELLSGNQSSVDFAADNAAVSNEKNSYSITFLEMGSSAWGCVDRMELSIKDLSLTFIDDFQGKDMPIFRGNLTALKMHMERGLGIDTFMIDAEAPSALTAVRPPPGAVAPIVNQDGQRRSDLSSSSETILKFDAISQTRIDYYHSRVAVWEPFLEACQLCLSIERQAGGAARPGQLSVDFSDRFLGEGLPSTAASSPQSVCLNLTDAAAEVIFGAISEWEKWRKSNGGRVDGSDEELLPSPVARSSGTPPSLQNSAMRREKAQDWGGSASIGHGEFASKFQPSPLPRVPDQASAQSRAPSPSPSPADQVATPEIHEASARLGTANKAAQAALRFARKRGAETQNKGSSAEPFVFRNRTGIPTAFIQGNQCEENIRKQADRGEEDPRSTCSRRSSSLNFIELEDGQDARFHMDMTEAVSSTLLSSEGAASDSAGNLKRVRAYDGQLPCLTVVFKTVDGVRLDPICNLPVFKVGSSIRRLRIHRDRDRLALSTTNSEYQDHYSVAVVWNVEVENNRRVLTLSSAVSIMSLGFNTSIEVGVKSTSASTREQAIPSGDEDIFHQSGIVSIGSARPGTPFYLPLRFAMGFEEVSVFVRPENEEYLYFSTGPRSPSKLSDNLFSWGRGSILEFVPVQLPVSDAAEEGLESTEWIWRETFSSVRTVLCDQIGLDNGSVPPAFLSCYASAQTSGVNSNVAADAFQSSISEKSAYIGKYDFQKVLTVGIDAALSLRNLLPLSLEWEISHRTSEHSPATLLDGSSVRQQNLKNLGFMPVPYPGALAPSQEECVLASGACSEVFACDIAEMNVFARFRCNPHQSWSQWASICLPPSSPDACVLKNSSNEVAEKSAKQTPSESSEGPFECHRPKQLNIQIKDDFGVPLTLGVRLFPKLFKKSDEEGSPNVCFGVDVAVHAELWLRNLTKLPIAFGCPSVQIHVRQDGELGDGEELSDENAGKVAAEAALMEIAGVLEFGDRGVLLNTPREDAARVYGDIHLLPYQASHICEEVFEYIEIDSSTVIRRWWASEKHDSCRKKPMDYGEEGDGWYWIDSSWLIDCTGQAKASEDGWESCRNLVGIKENTFSATRTFNPSHPFRRRRWFRRRAFVGCEATDSILKPYRYFPESDTIVSWFQGGINAVHQPVFDSFTRAQKVRERKARNKKRSTKEKESSVGTKGSLNVSIKCGDGEWSMPAVIPDSGQAHGVFRVLSSRWPALTVTKTSRALQGESVTGEASDKQAEVPRPQYKAGNLSPEVFELCFQVSSLSGDWGDFSRLMVVSPRYFLRNDSNKLTVEVKQAGAPNGTVSVLGPGQVTPFYWADIRLPELVSVRPLVDRYDGVRFYRWSGGVDLCSLGMTSVRVRHSRIPHSSSTSLRQQLESEENGDFFKLKSVRVLVEIRPGTGGTGINVSFKEENWNGEGSLFRVENLSSFPIWLAQDGVLSNPAATRDRFRSAQRAADDPPSKDDQRSGNVSLDNADGNWNFLDDHAEVDGDLVCPMSQTSFALDVPFRQGKYAGRRAASMEELLRVRAALAPLSSREGIESTKVIGFTNVGRCVRLNPAKLTAILSEEVICDLNGVRVLAVVTTDGPTRVLRFCLMQSSVSRTVFGGALAESNIHRKAPYGTSTAGALNRQATIDAADITVALIKTEGLLSESEAKQKAFFGGGLEKQVSQKEGAGRLLTTKPKGNHTVDLIFSFRASFEAFVFSLVDSTPSEISVLSLRGVHALAKWNTLRTSDATALVSVGWLQVDNHVPNAPFPVALCPDDENVEVETKADDKKTDRSDEKGAANSLPLLLIGLTFAPKHKSGILCLRSVTISPRNLAIAVDLASIVRFLNFIDGIKKHALRSQSDPSANDILAVPSVLDGERKRYILFPALDEIYRTADGVGAGGFETQKLYFEGFTILPCRVSFSVAPSRALTTSQASLEGQEAAAIHAAVRKGDLLIGNEGSVLGVHVGGKNVTPLAVVRGVFKSIVVDALLRCDGASMNLSGVSLRYHISSGPQLKTYLAAHYLQSLRQNVPALLGSLAAFGNPLGLIRGLGDGVSDFGSETVRGLKKSMLELDPTFAVDGVARGTESLARHAVGGFADSASLLTETFSKNMAVLTLDRRYAQRRDRGNALRDGREFSTTFVEGVESGVAKLVRGFLEGVTGVVRAPIRGAEKRGMEGFAKGIGKGLLGLLVKPMIGLSDAATDVMLGVKGSVEGSGGSLQRGTRKYQQVRPRRPMYGRDSTLRPYQLADAAASALMMRTRLAGERYLSHYDLEDRVALLSVKRLLLLDSEGQELLMVSFRHMRSVKVRQSNVRDDGASDWRVIILLRAPRANGSEVEAISCDDKAKAEELCAQIQRGMNLYASDSIFSS